MGDQLTFWRLCRDGDIEGVQAAIDNRANVNEEDDSGWTGLMMALGNSHNNVVQLLLNHPQIDVNIVNRAYGYCALHYAVNGHNHKGMAALLARQDLTTINQRSNEGKTPIMFAVGLNRVNWFKLLLAHPQVDLNQKDYYGQSPITEAIDCNSVNCFKLLLAHPELDLDIRDNRYRYQRSPEEVHR